VLLTWAKALHLPGTKIAANLAWKKIGESVRRVYVVLEMNRHGIVFMAVS
jgi:hypothetical protein